MWEIVKRSFLLRLFGWLGQFFSGVGLVRDAWEWQKMITETWPVAAPFLKMFGVSFGSALVITAIVWVVLFWQEREEKEARGQSSHSRFARIAALADRVERRQATAEEEQEYYELITSFWGRVWFQDYDSRNYKEISKRARSLAERLFFC